MITIGIDYSLNSPAVTVHEGKVWDISNCSFHFFCKGNLKKKTIVESFIKGKIPNIDLFPSEYPSLDSFSCQTERFSFLSDWVLSILKMYDSKDIKVWIEGYSYGSTGNRLFEIGENTGLLKYKLYSKGIPFFTVPPSRVKKWATGKGNANKQLMEESFISETDINLRNVLGQTVKQFNPSSDVIDAFYICSYGHGKETSDE